MKIILSCLALLIALPLITLPRSAQAIDCYQDPIHDRAWSGQITTAAFFRSGPCTTGTTIIKTLALGTKINITGETDGWYRVKDSTGTEGWVGQWLIGVTSTSGFQDLGNSTSQSSTSSSTTTSAQMINRTAGYILLQVEEHGESWYVDPVSRYRYYMKDGSTAYEMMRKFGLGITNADLIKLQAGDSTLKNRLKGRILLQVQSHGEAYYVHPATGVAYYMKDGNAAYELMRYYSLGISNADLNLIPSRDFVPIQ